MNGYHKIQIQNNGKLATIKVLVVRIKDKQQNIFKVLQN